MYTIRLLLAGLRLNLKTLSRSAFFLFVSAVQPIAFASVAVLLLRGGDGHDQSGAVSLTLGSALLGMWSTTVYGSSSAIRYQRFTGTLDLVLGSQANYLTVLAAQTIATTVVGGYGVVATLLWSSWVLGVPLGVANLGAFVAALLATIASLGVFGLLLAAFLVGFRRAQIFANLMEYPMWLLGGVLFPISVLPGWLRPPSLLFAPMWGARAVREAAAGVFALPAIGACLGLTAVYLAGGAVLVKRFELRARRRGTLSLT